MRLSTLLQNIRHPPANTMVGHMTRVDGSVMRTVPFMMLIHLIWLFLWPVLNGASFRHVILPTILSLPVFLYFHLCTYFYEGSHFGRARYIAGVFLLAYVLSPFNLSGMGYLIYGYFSLAFTMPMRFTSRVIAASIVLFTIEMLLLEHRINTIISVDVPLMIFGVVAVYTGYTTLQQAVLKRSREEIMRLATLAERERIGRDLHDLLGHTLSLVALKSELARKLIDRDIDAARSEIGEVERVARDALSQVRTAVAGIRGTALAAELASATSLLKAQGLSVECDTEPVKLPIESETALAMSLREAATNVGRHANATGVTIRVRREAEAVIMEVADNGHGGRILYGNGLNGMRERLASVGGDLLLLTNKDGGTLLRASVPLAA